MKQIISTEHAPKAIGPYSQAVAWNGLVYLSGQIALDPESGQLVDGGITEQTERVLENLKAVLEAAGSDLAHVLKTTVFLKDMAEFAHMNEIYGHYFAENRLPGPRWKQPVCPATSGSKSSASPRFARAKR